MIKHGIDQEALIKQFSQATAQQGEALRKAVTEATVKALQGRELTLANIKQVLGTVTKAASAGAANNPLASTDVEQGRRRHGRCAGKGGRGQSPGAAANG